MYSHSLSVFSRSGNVSKKSSPCVVGADKLWDRVCLLQSALLAPSLDLQHCFSAFQLLVLVNLQVEFFAFWKAHKISTLCERDPTYARIVASISTAWPWRCLTPTT